MSHFRQRLVKSSRSGVVPHSTECTSIYTSSSYILPGPGGCETMNDGKSPPWFRLSQSSRTEEEAFHMFEPSVFTVRMKHETMTREMRETFTESNSTWGPRKEIQRLSNRNISLWCIHRPAGRQGNFEAHLVGSASSIS